MKWDKEKIKKLRKDLRLTQNEFARRLGCRQQTVSEWEQGMYLPANAYGKLLDFFARETSHEISAEDETQTPKRISTFSLPRVKVPEVFREEMGLGPEDLEEPELRPFDPCID